MTPAISPAEFVANWSKVTLPEMAAAQSHFNDLCALVGHDLPHIADPTGKFFRFETPTAKAGGKRGRADAAYKGKFIFEYKGAHADLNKAYQQLLLYKDALGNPPLLITSDTRDIIIHTNFTNTVKETHTVTFDRLLTEDGLDLLQRIFRDPESFRPERTQEQVTQATADTFINITQTLQAWETHAEAERLAHFIIRLLFCLFAEDMGLLPDHAFTELIKRKGRRPVRQFTASLSQLFGAMRTGGPFGFVNVPHFDGGLFDDDYVPDLPSDIVDELQKAAVQDWSGIDPSIYGTLFERVIDESKRVQLGTHYTSKEDILLIVEPVLMKPLRDRWESIKHQSMGFVNAHPDKAHALLKEFSDEIAATRVLDPACGSGNFLYVALWQLLNLQKEVIAFAGRHGLSNIPLTVSPAQLYGIEINAYAHELAQTTIWMGYIQWRFKNGFPDIEEPILRPLRNVEHKDAILTYDADGNPIEPSWPEVDIIIGNPPFLGSKKMRYELSEQYVDALNSTYSGRVPAKSDLVCYWFERSRELVVRSQAKRCGLIATQAIRHGLNRTVLDRIKNDGDIFLAYSDRVWILDGASVQVSIIGFDNGLQPDHFLDGNPVTNINSNLTALADLNSAHRLMENRNLAFSGTKKYGPFEINASLARTMLDEPDNPNGLPNSDVIKPWVNGRDIAGHRRNLWIIDFGIDTSVEDAAMYRKPFDYALQHVKPSRKKVRMKKTRDRWWLFQRSRPEMWAAISRLERFIVTPAVSKHRFFTWLQHPTVPDQQLAVIARQDDYFLGLLDSWPHELWVRTKGSQLREAESGTRYILTTSFETYPFPWPPGHEPPESENPLVFAIAQAARDLVGFRQDWLHPPKADIGITIPEKIVTRLTLTNLYNALIHYRDNFKGALRSPGEWRKFAKSILTLKQIEQLDYIHTSLDRAVLDAYGWSYTLTDEQILERLLALNLERAAVQSS